MEWKVQNLFWKGVDLTSLLFDCKNSLLMRFRDGLPLAQCYMLSFFYYAPGLDPSVFWCLQMEPVDGKLDLEFGEDIPLSSTISSRKGVHPLVFETSSAMQREVPDSQLIKKLRISPFSSIYTVLIKAKINVLLPFGPLAILLHYLTHKHVSSTILP